MSDDTLRELLQPQWFLPLFAALWFGMSALFSLISGWGSLASLYPSHDDPAGERFRFRSGSLGRQYFPVNYGNCLFVTVNERGFKLSILFPFRFMCPPMFIPWDKVDAMEKRRVFFFGYHVVSFRDHWSRLSVRGSVGEVLKKHFDVHHADKKSKRALG